MVEVDGSMVPEGPEQGAREHDDLRAKLQELTEFIRDLKQRVESRQERDDAQSKAAGHDVAFEEYQKRMKEHDARMAESDARIDELMRDNRRRIDELERRWGIGGSRDE